MATLSAFGDPIDDDEPQAFSSATAPKAQPAPIALSAFGDPIEDDSPNRTAGQWVTDIGGSVGRGAYNLFDAAAGLGDIVSGGAVTPWLAGHGLDSKAARAQLDAEMSPQARAQQQEVANAQGFLPTAKAMVMNPAYAAGQIIESVPTMVVGGVAGKGAALGAEALGLNAARAGVLGAGTGEGLATAGSQAAQTVQQTGDLTAAQTAAALGAGGLTGILGAASAGLGARLGVADIDAQLAGATAPMSGRGLLARLGIGAGLEAGEESLQSGQEQVLQNAALGQPLTLGVGNAAGQGAVLGGVMGGAAGFRRPDFAQQSAAPSPVLAPQSTQPKQAAAMSTQQPAYSETAAVAATPMQTQTKQESGEPFAGSRDITPLLDNLGVQGNDRVQSLYLLRPTEADIEARRRGVVTQEEQRRLAGMIGLKGAEALSFQRKIGQAWNAEQIIASTDLVSDRLKSVLEQQQRIASGQASDIEKADFVQHIGDLKSVFGELMGARAESGRALAAQRRQVQNISDARRILEGVGGVDGADALAMAIGKAVQSGGVANASKLIGESKKGLWDYYFRAALLSGVRTHVVNIASNTTTLGNEIIERSIAAGIGGAKRALSAGKAGQTLLAEPLDLLMGMAKGATKAGTAAIDAARTGESAMLGGGKFDNASGVSNTPRPTGMMNTAKWAAQGLASAPYRLLGAEDAFFANLNYEAELRALARQQAVKERNSGAIPTGVKNSQRIEQLVQNPTPAMIEQAGEHARVQTFNQKAGAFASAIMSAKAKQPWLNAIVPFVRTPANIVTFGLRRTPAAALFKDVREDFKAGGAKQERAAARVLWGTSVMIAAGMAANAGYITGAGPADKEEKKALLTTGWRPYSIKVGDTYSEYNRFDPFAQWLSMAADFATNDYRNADASEAAASLVGSVANATVNKTYMQGISNLSEFLSDPNRNGAWYSRQMAGTLAQPFTLLSNIAAEQDPFARETNSVLDAIKYRIPGFREELPIKLDAFGEPTPDRNYPGGALSIAAPFAQSTLSSDPVRKEAGRLGWSPSAQQPFFSADKRRYDLSTGQTYERDELVGQLSHSLIRKAINADGWANLDDDEKRNILDKLTKQARSAVKLAFIPYLAKGNRAAVDQLRRKLKGPK